MDNKKLNKEETLQKVMYFLVKEYPLRRVGDMLFDDNTGTEIRLKCHDSGLVAYSMKRAEMTMGDAKGMPAETNEDLDKLGAAIEAALETPYRSNRGQNESRVMSFDSFVLNEKKKHRKKRKADTVYPGGWMIASGMMDTPGTGDCVGVDADGMTGGGE